MRRRPPPEPVAEEIDADNDVPDLASLRLRRQGGCELCCRGGVPLTFHHLIPRAVHKKRRYREQYVKEEMQRRGLFLCRLCHGGIHTLIPSEQELGERYNTREALLAHEGVARHVAWAAKQKR